MASDTRSTRISNNCANKPRLTARSRTSSLKYLHPAVTTEESNLTIHTSSADANLTNNIPASSWSPTERFDFTTEDEHVLDPANNIYGTNYEQRSTCRDTSAAMRTSRRSASCAPTTMRNPTRTPKVKQWAGLTRTVSDWDGLRRDPELWFEDGDCFVHLSAYGQSRRGPSFCVPSQALRDSKCDAIFNLYFSQPVTNKGPNLKATRRLSSEFNTSMSNTNMIELYIPAPGEVSRTDAFDWHITTRNFFAFVLGKPLVGCHLGKTLVQLQERIRIVRPGNLENHQDLVSYLNQQGYMDFVECADYALAMLYYAEHYKLRDIWIDAFAHCVGMNESLALCGELESVSRLTKALITRAYLEMDIYLGKVMLAVNNFLEDDMSPALVGLSDGGRAELDRFRSFLHSFYVGKFGYWPPPNGVSFSKALYKSLRCDFASLYDYLVDLESTPDLASQKATGGVCCFQLVAAFDTRHNFFPLPHPLPLLPQYEPSKKMTQSQKSLKAFNLGSNKSKAEQHLTSRAALAAATNKVPKLSMVEAYMQYERAAATNSREDKVTIVEARKIRWLLIYGTLQWLISALRAPAEVTDTETDYPLCCLVTEHPPWQSSLDTSDATPMDVPKAINDTISEVQALTIQPDCETDESPYFAPTNLDATPVLSRHASVERSAPSSAVSDTSRRSLRRISVKSRSFRRNAPSNYPDMDIYASGNNISRSTTKSSSYSRSTTNSSLYKSSHSKKSSIPEGAAPDASLLQSSNLLEDLAGGASKQSLRLQLSHTDINRAQARTPVLESSQFDMLISPITPDEPHGSSSDSTTSIDSPFWSDKASYTSSKSSTTDEHRELNKNSAEDYRLLAGLKPIIDTRIAGPQRMDSWNSASSITPGPDDRFRFSFNNTQSFDAVEVALARLEDSAAEVAESSIGVAVSGTPHQHAHHDPSLSAPSAALAFDDFTADRVTDTATPRRRSMSMSATTLAPSYTNTISPSLPAKKKVSGFKDIFSGFSLAPSESQTAWLAGGGGAGFEEFRKNRITNPVLDSIPKPITSTPTVKPTKNFEEPERGRKRERRMSFWRR